MIRVHNASVDDKFDGTPVRANDSIIVDEAAGSWALSLLDGGLGYFIIKRCSRAAVQWPVAGSRSSKFKGSCGAVKSSKATESRFKVLSPINYESVSIRAERKVQSRKATFLLRQATQAAEPSARRRSRGSKFLLRQATQAAEPSARR